jgi:hypothetical protein
MHWASNTSTNASIATSTGNTWQRTSILRTSLRQKQIWANSTIHAYPDNAAVIDGEFITTKYDNYSVMKYNLSTTASPGGDDPANTGTGFVCFTRKFGNVRLEHIACRGGVRREERLGDHRERRRAAVGFHDLGAARGAGGAQGRPRPRARLTPPPNAAAPRQPSVPSRGPGVRLEYPLPLPSLTTPPN